MPGYKPKSSSCCKLCLDDCSDHNPAMDKDVITVGIGGCRVAKPPCILKTTLGSCVGVALYDKSKQLGGLIHIMLPDSSKLNGRLTKFADTGVANLINCMVNEHQSSRSLLVARIFGGAKMFNIFSKVLDIGTNNIDACINALHYERIKIEGGKTGGTQGTQIVFRTNDGKIIFRTIGGKEEVY